MRKVTTSKSNAGLNRISVVESSFSDLTIVIVSIIIYCRSSPLVVLVFVNQYFYVRCLLGEQVQ